MTTTSCTQVRNYIRQVLDSPGAVPLDPALVEHVAGCSTCHGALVLMRASLTANTHSAAPIGCAECQRLLAAFIDVEASEGSAAALREYPQVAEHLWSCTDCAEIYQQTVALIAAEQSGMLAPLPLLPSMPLLLPTIHLRRSFLNAALPAPRARRATTRGGATSEQVLYAEQLGQYHVRLRAQRHADDRCTLLVDTLPAARGSLRLRLGSHTADVRLYPAGHAQLADLPPALLDAQDGPDLVIEIAIDAA